MIDKILNDFIACWKQYNGKPMMTNEDAAAQINRGDCGLAAIATHYVLREKFGIETQIVLNRNHCWQLLNDVDYDTSHVNGYPAEQRANDVWSRGGPDPISPLTFGDACNEWMPCDAFGGFLVQGFVRRYGLDMPAELQHCITEAAEYESPDAVPGLQAKSDALASIAISV